LGALGDQYGRLFVLYAPTHDTDFEPNNSIVPSPKMYFCFKGFGPL